MGSPRNGGDGQKWGDGKARAGPAPHINDTCDDRLGLRERRASFKAGVVPSLHMAAQHRPPPHTEPKRARLGPRRACRSGPPPSEPLSTSRVHTSSLPHHLRKPAANLRATFANLGRPSFFFFYPPPTFARSLTEISNLS